MGIINRLFNRENLSSRKTVINLIKSTFTSGVAAGVAQLLMVVYSILAARLLKPDSYGVMAACYSATVLTSFLFNWGLDSWLLRSAATSPSPLKMAGDVLRIKIITGLVWGLGLWLVLPAVRPELYLADILLLVLIDTFFDSLTNIIYVILTVMGRIPEASGLMIVNRILRLSSVLVLVFWSVDNLLLLVLLRMLVTVTSFAAGSVISRPILRGSFMSSKRTLASETAPFALSEILTLGYSQFDLNLVSAFVGDKNLVGNYSVVISLVNAVSAVVVSITNVLLPVLTRVYQRRSRKFLQAVLLSLGCFLLLGGMISFGTTIWGEDIVQIILGKDYSLAGIYLTAIAPLFLLRALSQTGSMLLVVVNLQKQRLYSQVSAVISKVIGGIWAFPKWQVSGNIRVYMFSEFIMLIGYVALFFHWYRSNWLRSEDESRKI